MSITIKNMNGEIIRELETNSTFDLDLKGADLQGADLRRVRWIGVDLRGSNLQGANFQGAYLGKANLSRAKICEADFSSSQLWEVCFSHSQCEKSIFTNAKIGHTNFSRTWLMEAKFHQCNIEGVDFYKADLRYAEIVDVAMYESCFNFSNLANSKIHFNRLHLGGLPTNTFLDANLRRAEIDKAISKMLSITPQGEFIAYKKTREGVVTLKIPKEARRSNATSRKCRAEFATPIEMPEGFTECTSLRCPDFKYRLNEVARPDRWGEDRWIECGGGIHFFLTREEAEIYSW